MAAMPSMRQKRDALTRELGLGFAEFQVLAPHTGGNV